MPTPHGWEGDRYLEFYESVYEKVEVQWLIGLFETVDEAEAWFQESE
jgi:hypothetical protein